MMTNPSLIALANSIAPGVANQPDEALENANLPATEVEKIETDVRQGNALIGANFINGSGAPAQEAGKAEGGVFKNGEAPKVLSSEQQAVANRQEDLNAWLESDKAKEWFDKNDFSQQDINKLKVDATGSWDAATEDLTKVFQRYFRDTNPNASWASAVDGIIGPKTMRQLDMELGRKEMLIPEDEFRQTIARQHSRWNGIGHLPELAGDFLERTVQIAKEISVDPRDLLTIMSFETGGTFDPAKKNGAGSGATGLIQFMPSTARELGTTTSALAGMSQTEQLEYVRSYFHMRKSELGEARDLESLYMHVLLPKAANLSNDAALFAANGNAVLSGPTAYRQNRGLDVNGDGIVQKRETRGHLDSHYQRVINQFGDRLSDIENGLSGERYAQAEIGEPTENS